MASIERTEPRLLLREVNNHMMRPSVMPAIRWGAVLAGVTVGLAVQWALSLFALAAGLGSLLTDQADGTGLIMLAWTAIGALASSFIGGFVAGRMSNLRRKADGLLHGAVTWGVAMLLISALSAYMGGKSPAEAWGGLPASVAGMAQAEDSRLTVILRAMLGGDVSVEDERTLERYIRSGQGEEAILLLSALGMDPVRAAMAVDQAMIAAGNRPGAGPMQAVSRIAAWTLFGSVLLALLSAMAGGLTGAIGSRRPVWRDVASAPQASA